MKIARKCPIDGPSRVVERTGRAAGTDYGGNMSNRKYLFLQRSVPGKQQQPSPGEMQEMYSAFNAWKERFKENILDMGGKLAPGGKVVTSAGATDGPFVEAKEIVGGYMLVSAESMDLALEVAKGMGFMMQGSSIEIREAAGP